MRCSVKKCPTHDGHPSLGVLDDGDERMILCPNHLVVFALYGFSRSEVRVLSTEQGSPETCELCGKHAMTFRTDRFLFQLCEEHMMRLFKTHLLPDEWSQLREEHGNVYWLHEDFYDDDGMALQPADI